MVIVEAPFVEELSGMAIIKVLDMNEHITSMIKLKFIRNKVTSKITNNTSETVTFDRKDMIGILDIKSNKMCCRDIWANTIILSWLKMFVPSLIDL